MLAGIQEQVIACFTMFLVFSRTVPELFTHSFGLLISYDRPGFMGSSVAAMVISMRGSRNAYHRLTCCSYCQALLDGL
jgi:hypothetical protein